ncbi:MAG: hydrogenase maturation protease [Sedimentisphaerales bacterium]|nr:hydrogenase maturation protease [Sedimentisphaerales bacterium]
MKPTLIICLGNPLMRDEGIGVRLATELSQRLADNPNTEVVDLGTGGLTIMHAILSREKVVFVDCALMGEASGVMRRFTPEEVVSKKIKTRYSVHEGDLLEVLKLSTDMGECPDDIVIFGIEPKEIASGEGLSDELQSNIQHYLETILNEIENPSPS